MLKPINIAICDDEKIQVDLFLKYVNNWADKSGRKITIEKFHCAESFHFKWLEDKLFNIILLDIEMPGQNGVELAKTIRKTDKMINIIFITAVEDFLAEGYDLDAINYLLKPIEEVKLHSCLDRAIERMPLKTNKIVIQTEDGNQTVNEKDILLIESVAHNIEITTKDKAYTTRMNLASIEEDLHGNAFVKAHRSYIVNLLHIKKITKDTIELDNGDKVPLSRRRYKEVNMEFIKFFRGEIGE